LAATLDRLMGEPNGGCSTAKWCPERLFFAVILEEGDD
jgi:hypothetical protein